MPECQKFARIPELPECQNGKIPEFYQNARIARIPSPLASRYHNLLNPVNAWNAPFIAENPTEVSCGPIGATFTVFTSTIKIRNKTMHAAPSTNIRFANALFFFQSSLSFLNAQLFSLIGFMSFPVSGFSSQCYYSTIHPFLIQLHASVKRSMLHAAFAGLVEGRQTAGLPVFASEYFR